MRVHQKLVRGVVLVADYGLPRHEFMLRVAAPAPLQCYSHHRVLSSPLEEVGESDITAHVEYESRRARQKSAVCNLVSTDQHRSSPVCFRAVPASRPPVRRRAGPCKTLLHPNFSDEIPVPGADEEFPRVVRRIQVARDARSNLGWSESWAVRRMAMILKPGDFNSIRRRSAGRS